MATRTQLRTSTDLQGRAISSVPTATGNTPAKRPGVNPTCATPNHPSRSAAREHQLTGDQQRHDTRDAERTHRHQRYGHHGGSPDAADRVVRLEAGQTGRRAGSEHASNSTARMVTVIAALISAAPSPLVPRERGVAGG